jgi:hypothetical protein
MTLLGRKLRRLLMPLWLRQSPSFCSGLIAACPRPKPPVLLFSMFFYSSTLLLKDIEHLYISIIVMMQLCVECHADVVCHVCNLNMDALKVTRDIMQCSQ